MLARLHACTVARLHEPPARVRTLHLTGPRASLQLHVNFNISMHHLPCNHIEVDAADTMGTHKYNLTRRIRKWKLVNENTRLDEMTDHPTTVEHADVYHDGDQISTQMKTETFFPMLTSKPIVLVNYYAPWCIWSQRLSPVWEKAAQLLKDEELDGEVMLAKVDCTARQERVICWQQQVSAFPTVMVYQDRRTWSKTGYNGDRTPEAIVAYVKKMLAYRESRTVPVAERAMEHQTQVGR
jgi:thiol-disulfide isomerase/thioredoxin